MNEPNDISLVTRVILCQDTKAFELLVKKYQSPIRRFFLNLTLGDSALSDDLAQDTFIKCYTHITSFKNLSGFSTWLYRIAYNVFYDYTRSRKEQIGLDLTEIDRSHPVEPENVGRKLDLYESLKILKESERSCMILFYMEDLSIEQIAKILNYPQGTVKVYLSRARNKLANYLKQNGYDGNRS